MYWKQDFQQHFSVDLVELSKNWHYPEKEQQADRCLTNKYIQVKNCIHYVNVADRTAKDLRLFRASRARSSSPFSRANCALRYLDNIIDHNIKYYNSHQKWFKRNFIPFCSTNLQKLVERLCTYSPAAFEMPIP